MILYRLIRLIPSLAFMFAFACVLAEEGSYPSENLTDGSHPEDITGIYDISSNATATYENITSYTDASLIPDVLASDTVNQSAPNQSVDNATLVGSNNTTNDTSACTYLIGGMNQSGDAISASTSTAADPSEIRTDADTDISGNVSGLETISGSMTDTSYHQSYDRKEEALLMLGSESDPDLAIFLQIVLDGVAADGAPMVVSAQIINIGPSDINSSFYVQFYEESIDGPALSDPILMQEIRAGEQIPVNLTYTLHMGSNDIIAIVDKEGLINESDESNNIMSIQQNVSIYTYYYGWVHIKFSISNSEKSFFSYPDMDPAGENIYFAEENSIFAFSNLKAIGRDKFSQPATDDFSDIDSNLGSFAYSDSVRNIWADAEGFPRTTSDFLIDGRNVENVPIVGSSSAQTFQTGILWDTSDDVTGNGEYDTTDKEDLIFVTQIRPTTPGAYGTYDFEAKIPVMLATYKNGNGHIFVYIELH